MTILARNTTAYNGIRLHAFAIFVWVVLWLALRYINDRTDLNLFGSTVYWPLYLIPFTLGITNLSINAYLTRNVKAADAYEKESRIIEFVERNASWFLLASVALYGWATFANGSGTSFDKAPFVIYTSLSSILVAPTILLYWIPFSDTRDLMILRIRKTIPFTYAVSFFTAAIITLMIGVLPK